MQIGVPFARAEVVTRAAAIELHLNADGDILIGPQLGYGLVFLQEPTDAPIWDYAGMLCFTGEPGQACFARGSRCWR